MDHDNADLATILADYVPRHEYEDALSALNEAVTERDTLRTTGETASKRAAELEGKYRGQRYKSAYEKVRKDVRVKDKLADDVYRLLELKVEADEPDEGAIKSALEKFVKDRPDYLEAGEETPRDRRRKEIEAGEGSARGRSGNPGDKDFPVTRAQLADALWMRSNQNRVFEAQRAGTFRIEDEA